MFHHKIVIASLISAFFPYLPGGVRVEHILFPCVFAIFSLISDAQARTISLPALLMSILLLLGAVFAIIFSLFLPDAGAMSPLSAMSTRLLLPAIVLAAIAVSVPATSNIMMNTAETIVLIAVPTTLLALGTALFDISFLVKFFVKSDDDSVWSQAFSLGRYTGLFNQPLEAGVFYSVALLALVYLMSIKSWRPAGRYLILAAILLGGFLSLSKNFVVLGVLMALVYAVAIRVISLQRGVAILCLAVGILFVWLLNSGGDAYLNSFIELFEEGGLLLALTAGRLGTGDTEVAQLWKYLLNSGKWTTGVGLGSHLPLDNGYLEYFYQGGVLALICYLLLILYVLIFSIRRWSANEAKLLFFLGVFVAASSLGGPVVSANRANVPLLVLIASCVLSMSAYKTSNE